MGFRDAPDRCAILEGILRVGAHVAVTHPAEFIEMISSGRCRKLKRLEEAQTAGRVLTPFPPLASGSRSAWAYW